MYYDFAERLSKGLNLHLTFLKVENILALPFLKVEFKPYP